MRTETSGLTLLDGHVHIHDCFELPWLLDGSYRNFAGEAGRQDRSAAFEGVLLLTETAKAHWFQRLTELADQNLAVKCADGASWQFARTGEDCSVAANRSTGERLILVAGRQIVTAERLDMVLPVLLVACDRDVERMACVEEKLFPTFRIFDRARTLDAF